MTEHPTLECPSCHGQFHRSELVYYESEGGFYPDGFYCKQCVRFIEAEEEQIDAEDTFDVDED